MKKYIAGIAVAVAIVAVAGVALAATNFKWARETATIVYYTGDPVHTVLGVTNATSTQQTYSIEAYVYGYCPAVYQGGVEISPAGSVTLPIDGFPQDITLAGNASQSLTASFPAPSPIQDCGTVGGGAFTVFSYVHAQDGTVQANTSKGFVVAQ